MITVKLPDGGIAKFPDGMPAADIERVLAEQFGAPPTQNDNPYSSAAYDAQAVDAGAPIPGMPQPFARQAQQVAGPDLMGSTAATLAGINTIPLVGPLLQNTSDAILGTGASLMGGDYGETVRGLQQRREELARANPIANVAGSVAANLAGFGLAAAPRAVAQGLSPAALTLAGGETVGSSALGLTGSTGAKVVNGIGSTLGLMTADGMARGEAPVDALANAVLPGLVGGAIPAVGAGLKSGAESIASALTKRAQGGLTAAAIQGAPDAAALKTAASSMFDAATGGTPLAITDNAFFRFLGGVKQYADKLRINADNDPQATGLLSTLMRIADETGTGVAVDLKDLHLVRQLARKVSGSNSGRDASLGSEVVRQLDDLIESLSPSDILGGADPTAASSALMNGISTWSRASKVGVIEEAIEKAGTYKSGLENGLRLQFQALLRNPETRRLFTEIERSEIEKVANGTAATNLVTLLGKFGFSNNGAPNWMGGITGFAAGSMTPLGPLGGLAAAGLGAGARRFSETLGANAATRAAQVVATPNIPVAPRVNVPPQLLQGIPIAELLAKGSLLAGAQE